MSEASGRVTADDLARFVARVFERLGAPPADARSVAELMVEADLRGYDTHGVFRLRQYVDRLRAGGVNPRPRLALVTETAATALLDGDNGLGHLALRRATELAIGKADAAGIGWVGVRHGNHAGPAALYVLPQTERGMIGLCAAVGSANHVPPFGGSDLLLGTNPIAIGVPAGEQPPFVLDMATTVAAVGRIKTLAQRGEPMPAGWMVGPDGHPLTDPTRREEGFLLPIGGAKGYGLALAIGLLAGVLNGAACGRAVVDFTKDPASPTNTGQFVAAIRVAAFGDPARFGQAVDALFDQMRASTPLPGHEPVRIPGRAARHDPRRAAGGGRAAAPEPPARARRDRRRARDRRPFALIRRAPAPPGPQAGRRQRGRRAYCWPAFQASTNWLL